VFPVEALGRPFWHGGRRFGLVLARNMTNRKRAEEALRRSEAYLAEAQRLTHTGSWAWSALTQELIYWSEEMFRIWGFDPHQGPPDIETQWQRIHPEDFKTLLQEKIERAKSGDLKTDTTEEYRIGLPDGTLKYIHATSHPVFDDSGKVIEYIGANVDVTERKRAEEALHRSEAYLAEAQRLTHTGSWAWDPQRDKMLHCSEEVSRLYGLDPRDGVPTFETLSQRIHPEDRDRIREATMEGARRRVEQLLDYRIVLPDGSLKYIQSVRRPVLNEAGDIVEIVGSSIDVTERKRTEEERERLRQLEADLAHINRVSIMGELAASVAHEVNQPLTGIVSNGSACLRWLAGDTPNLEEAREAVRDIVRDGKRAGEVIARIRALTRRAAPPKEKLDLNEVVREVLALVGDQAKKNNVIIRSRFADDVWPVLGDQVQLQQVLLNLVMNGMEAMTSVGQPERQLLITTQNIDPDQVQVTVQDSGVGLDSNAMPRIFEAFYTTKSGGMGMGLSISRSIVQNHGGRLWPTTNAGPGTSFHFTLPKYQREESNAGSAAV
jgi:PAS domain S-box-containing protein